jgi:hypothetical protein
MLDILRIILNSACVAVLAGALAWCILGMDD